MSKLYFWDTGIGCSLLGIEKELQLKTHPLRGALFENMIIAETMKRRLATGLPPNLFFLRTHKGVEIDLLQINSNDIQLTEIKSAQTANPEFAKSLLKWKTLTQKKNQKTGKTVVYDGPHPLSINDVKFTPWKEAFLL